jgi:hypothetical protein
MRASTLFFLLIFNVFVSGCVTESLTGQSTAVSKKMDSNRKISSAEGHLVVSSTQFNSNLIDLSVKNMSRPNKINPKARAYIVWEVPSGGNLKPQSIGVLVPDKNLNARLMTATPFKQFDLFITAEPYNNTGAPTGQKLLWTSVSR